MLNSGAAKADPEMATAFRTATIKSFEYAYELGVRLMRRALASMAASPQEIAEMDFRALMRTAAEKGLIDDPRAWFLYREKRNITAHTYDALQALDVLAAIPSFLSHIDVLLDRLKIHASDAS